MVSSNLVRMNLTASSDRTGRYVYVHLEYQSEDSRWRPKDPIENIKNILRGEGVQGLKEPLITPLRVKISSIKSKSEIEKTLGKKYSTQTVETLIMADSELCRSSKLKCSKKTVIESIYEIVEHFQKHKWKIAQFARPDLKKMGHYHPNCHKKEYVTADEEKYHSLYKDSSSLLKSQEYANYISDGTIITWTNAQKSLFKFPVKEFYQKSKTFDKRHQPEQQDKKTPSFSPPFTHTLSEFYLNKNVSKEGERSFETYVANHTFLTTTGLSMVKEEDVAAVVDHEDTPKNNTGTTMFDDVDLEANPQHLPTVHSNGHCSPSPNNGSGMKNTLGARYRGMANGVVHEVRTNPNLKFRVIVGLSMVLVASCLIAVAVAASSRNGQRSEYQEEEGAVDLSELLTGLESTVDTPAPSTASPISALPTSSPSYNPTASPSRFPTYDPTTYPTESLTTLSPSSDPTGTPTWAPSYLPTSDAPTYTPSSSPVTPSPTRDCNDEPGEHLTHNDKPRTCEWLDNGHNGAKSERKELNCLGSPLGDACKYTCRLYNDCMEYLLASLPEYTTEENNVSIGDSCLDKDGLFMSNGNVPRECSWLTEDPETAPAKKNLNCGTPDMERSELGVMCPGSCAGYNDCKPGGVEKASPHPLSGLNIGQMVADGGGGGGGGGGGNSPTPFPSLWQSDVPTSFEDRCHDKDGDFLTHMGHYRQCRWFKRDNIEEKKELNCGKTEIGLNCLESCPCEKPEKLHEILTSGTSAAAMAAGNIVKIVPTVSPTTYAPTPWIESKGILDESEEILTLTALSDTTVAKRDANVTFGDSKRLNVEHDPSSGNRERHALLLFDLGLVSASFGTAVGNAKLQIYSVAGADVGGVMLKKMKYTNWTEDEVTWSSMPGGDGADELTISYLDSLESNVWYDIDVTAAVRLALESGQASLGIRIVSEDDVDVYFGSKERVQEQPILVIDSKTRVPTYHPTYYPTYVPTSSPMVTLDCMNQKGMFTTNNGDEQPCSWLDVGNGDQKKELNCQQGEAAFFCQSSCGEYNGCDDLHCTDMSGQYQTHTGWTAECSWLSTGLGTLKLDMNCGTADYPITELGKRCQATCGDYNGCAR